MTQVSRRHLLAGAAGAAAVYGAATAHAEPLQISTSVPRQNSMKALISL